MPVAASLLIGATAQHILAERRSFAGGLINAGGSLGQFIFAPLNQVVMSAFGWMQAMWMMAVVALTTAPMAWWLRGTPRPPSAAGSSATELTPRQQLKIAARGACTPASSPAGFTPRSWSSTCRAK